MLAITTARLALAVAILALLWQIASWLLYHKLRIRVRVYQVTHVAENRAKDFYVANVYNKSGYSVTVKNFTFGPRGKGHGEIGPWHPTPSQVGVERTDQTPATTIETRGDADLELPCDPLDELTAANVVAWVELPGKRFRHSRRPCKPGGTFVH